MAEPRRRGRSTAVLRDDVLSQAFGLPIRIEHRDGRAWARMTTGGDTVR